jgi:hypothetical protein
MGATRPAYQAIVDAALNATTASSAWLLADREDEGLIVMATAGQAAAHQQIGAIIQPQGAKAYVLAAGQPTALLPQPGDTANADGGGAPGIPPSLLAVPCGDDDIVAVLEVSGKAGGATFGFEDINALSGLAQVAAAMVLERDDALRTVTSPAQLGAELENLAQRLPARYENVARVIEALLSIES